MTAATRTRLSVLGSPIAHSLSPVLHRAAYAELGLEWTYERHDVDDTQLDRFLGGCGPQWRGLSLTMPLKRRAFEIADARDRFAEATSAVNTLRWDDDGALHGFNTDVYGLITAITEAGEGDPDSVVILGGGATAASAILAVAELGASRVHLALRTPAKAAALEQLAAAAGVGLTAGSLDDLASVNADLAISTLPGGTAVAFTVPPHLAERALLFDVAYDPWPSKLGTAWTDAGGRAVSGVGMLLHQAVVQVRVFLTGDPEQPLEDEDRVIGAMRAALERAAHPAVA